MFKPYDKSFGLVKLLLNTNNKKIFGKIMTNYIIK